MDNHAAVPVDPGRRKLPYIVIVIGCITLLASWLTGFSYSLLGFSLIFVASILIISGLVSLVGKPAAPAGSRGFLYWSPRGLCIVYSVIVFIIASGEFVEGPSFWNEIVGGPAFVILMSMIPLMSPVFWRWDWVGGFYFVGLTLLFVAQEWTQLSDNWWTIKAPTIVLLLLPGVLFLFKWYQPKSITPETK